MSFSTYLKELRREKCLSQNELAKILKVSNSSIRNIEAGRTKLPRHEMFYNLADYVGGDPIDLAYDIFFRNEEEEYNHKFRVINKIFLASTWEHYFVIVPAPHFIYDNDKVMTFDGLYWKSGFPYYRVLLGYYNKKKYLAAINSKDKTNKLKEAIYSETLFIDDLENPEHIKEIRFILDKDDPDDRMVFEELSKIKLFNLGKEVEISYVLFDTKKKTYDSKTEKHYVTRKKSHIGI